MNTVSSAIAKPLLQVSGIHKYYGAFHAVNDVSFTLNEGDIGCLLGPSGCGKTTLLRTIAGFESIESGTISINGQTVAGSSFIPPEKRNIGMVFQDYALFPHLTVSQNVAFGIHGQSAKNKKQRITHLLELVGLQTEHSKYPHELSGGQQQRVALARALAPEPKLLLMDEPFSNLDVSLRESLSAEIRDILKAAQITALMVTHNQNEAFAMGDVIGVLSNGRMQQWDSPYRMYHNPDNTTVACFVGEGCLLNGTIVHENREEEKEKQATVEQRDQRSCKTVRIRCALGEFDGQMPATETSGTVTVLIRPEHVAYSAQSDVTAKIIARVFRGPNILYTLQFPSTECIQALLPSSYNFSTGDEIGIRPDTTSISLFPECGN